MTFWEVKAYNGCKLYIILQSDKRIRKEGHADLLVAYGTEVLFSYSKVLTLQTNIWQGNIIIYIFLVEMINAKIDNINLN